MHFSLRSEDNVGYVFTEIPKGLPHIETLRVEMIVKTQVSFFDELHSQVIIFYVLHFTLYLPFHLFRYMDL